MRTLHDGVTRTSVAWRIESLRPESARLWGRMTIDQMLWHVNQGLLAGLGEIEVSPSRLPLPPALVLPMVLNLPWPKGAPTAPAFEPRATYDFEEQRQQLLRLIQDFAQRDLSQRWPRHTRFGKMSGKHWSRLMYRHLDHHLRQFGA